MAEFPALPLWTDAYLADTTHLTAIEHGAYLLLLMAMWRTGDCRLPNDDRALARYAKVNAGQWSRMKATIMAFFKVDGDHIIQGRLSDEFSLVRERSRKQANRVRNRWNLTATPGAVKQRRGSPLHSDAANALKNNDSADTAVLPRQYHHTHTHYSSLRSECGGGGTRAPAGDPDTDQAPMRQPAPTGTDPVSTDARTVVRRFHELRRELWPTEVKFPAPELTLLTQAADYLQAAPLGLVIDVLERGMRSSAAEGRPSTHSLKAFHRSMANAAINHRNNLATTEPRNAQRTRGRQPHLDPAERERADRAAIAAALAGELGGVRRDPG